MIWGKLARERPVQIWGLPNCFAGRFMILSLLLTAISWILQITLNYSTAIPYVGMIGYFGVLMTIFFTHNLSLTVICPFEIFGCGDGNQSIHSDGEQAMEISRALQKPTASGPGVRRSNRSSTKAKEMSDTESSSDESDNGTHRPKKLAMDKVDEDGKMESTKPLSIFMFFSLFRPRRDNHDSMTSYKDTQSRNAIPIDKENPVVKKRRI